MRSKVGNNPRTGDEFVYTRNRNFDPVFLTYIENMPGGLRRYFSSQFPSLEYHIDPECEHVKPCSDNYGEEVQETYITFKGNDNNKRKAYEILMLKRGNNRG